MEVLKNAYKITCTLIRFLKFTKRRSELTYVHEVISCTLQSTGSTISNGNNATIVHLKPQRTFLDGIFHETYGKKQEKNCNARPHDRYDSYHSEDKDIKRQ